MKNPLHYQISEYDCGPTSLLNAISYLFEREEIAPEVIRNILLYCLDCYSADGRPGKCGTSHAAMMFLSNWLNGYGQTGQMPVHSKYLSGEEVFLGITGKVTDALRRGGVAVVRLYEEEEHYVLLTKQDGDQVYMFDPYFVEESVLAEVFRSDDIRYVTDAPYSHNRIVCEQCFNREDNSCYSLGPAANREAILIFNSATMQSEEKTIEYFI